MSKCVVEWVSNALIKVLNCEIGNSIGINDIALYQSKVSYNMGRCILKYQLRKAKFSIHDNGYIISQAIFKILAQIMLIT